MITEWGEAAAAAALVVVADCLMLSLASNMDTEALNPRSGIQAAGHEDVAGGSP
ncbi:hypothetical protein PMI07_006344 [Rhizobium sp. CF080]|nr:hypothetical protein PMI07_006344 [Rhizobium sp. CF080]